MPPSSAKAKHASSAMPMPTTQTVRKSQGCRVLMATSLAVRKMPEPMMPPASNRMESVSESPRTSLASLGNMVSARKLRLRYNRVFGDVVKTRHFVVVVQFEVSIHRLRDERLTLLVCQFFPN